MSLLLGFVILYPIACVAIPVWLLTRNVKVIPCAPCKSCFRDSDGDISYCDDHKPSEYQIF